MSAALALGIAAAAVAAAPARAMVPVGTVAVKAATSLVTLVSDKRRHHSRAYRSYRYGYAPYAQQGWVPYRLRGFEDPGFAYHGNVNGCAEDLGYGRWAPCNRGR
jgi:hypothetical protein